jgi:cysteine-rich repeat protein
MHIHLVQAQLLDRQPIGFLNDGQVLYVGPPVAPALEEAGWKDTFEVPPQQVTRVIMRFSDYSGVYPLHCHLLEHEDHEMMRQFLITECGNGIVDPDEQCDDGNTAGGDCCSSTCQFEPDGSTCTDGNACTSGDFCHAGICNPGGPTSCDDGNCCTIDACVPATGCAHTANTTAPVFTSQPSIGDTILWPPNHGYADFTVAATGAAAASFCGITSIQFASCSSSQPENGTGVGDGNTFRDCVYEPTALHLRAERDGACSQVGRVYEMRMAAVDVCGNTTTSNPFDVGVWRDRSNPPAGGTIVHATTGSNTSDTRNGPNGTYGTDCGAGNANVNGTSNDHTDADPEMEISENAAISVDDLHVDKTTSGRVLLTWSEPAHGATLNVTKFHVYRLDLVTLLWSQVAEVSKQTNTYVDPLLSGESGWQYKVTAVIK